MRAQVIVGAARRAANLGVGELAQASARRAEITQSMVGLVPITSAGPVQVFCASSSSLENLRLRVLIEGRSPSSASTTPTSLLDVFANPRHFRDQSLTGLLVEIVGEFGTGALPRDLGAKELAKRVIESHLKEAPLSKEGGEKINALVESFGLPAYQESMQNQSLAHGAKLLGGHGYEFEAEGLGRPRGLLLEAISLAQVGGYLTDWLKENRGGEEGKRIEAIAQLQVVIEMILGKESDWLNLSRNEQAWTHNGRYLTAEDIFWHQLNR